ncbi:carboxylesterase 3-like [Trichosurus vulpecula]|uniref:carboxylesterase 3-like n=1 Tax=Trichosurus vulpecula TaxID=9337 RepID=UPI00186B1EE7|nr:carboxylesterase 3-like [Trichosurus vulpecula]XP_036604073.1 carboxylesterase 3-like [Trichosurus vulpecula]XP_036604074.1 carboxylesterase 3-like [Trichosurus vulpecula]XP_036604075.1 carboxylesterase 3-like [Trichosurus vulpecula]XP_036604076.1 carboxylesterase 3-like [Trichosurus vulpecula]XP_036604077.1 carboxylesterase 3-like [Trichosurus vulpecula]
MPGGQKSLLWSLICITWLLILPAEGQEATGPEVVTQFGRVRGKQVAVKGTDNLVDVFLGVPFAKPPVGAGRFSPPQPAEPWEGVKDATVFPPMCLQELERTDLMKNTLDGKHQLFPISEDCLYLNIYTPASRHKKDKLPVMVWVHSGSLVIGAASSLDGSPLSAYEDIVVVIVQYRLGFQGFLSTGDEFAPGNWGFLDLVAALQWVQGNIAHFGGDPNCVTLSGQSAGGVCISALVLSPMTKGLFHRAISQSGTVIMPGVITDHPQPIFHEIAHFYGCEGSSSAVLIQCLRDKENMIFNRKFSSLSFIPATVDGAVLPKFPEKLLLENEFPRIPYLFGVTNHEFGHMVPSAWIPQNLDNGITKELALNLLKGKTALLGIPSELIHLAMEEYLGNQTDPVAIRDATLDLFGDFIIVFPAIKLSQKHRDSGAPVYFYEFHHRPSAFSKIKPAYVKSDHSAELPFIFGGPFMTNEHSMLAFPDSTEEEKQLSKMLMRYWANFIRKGDPNGEGLPNWPLYDQSETYLELNLTPKVRRKLKEDKMEFWGKLIREKAKPYNEGKKVHTEL